MNSVSLNATIREREDYLRAIEAQIIEATERGNAELMALNHDVLLAKDELRRIKMAIRGAQGDLRVLNDEIARQQDVMTISHTELVVMPVLRPLLP